MEIRGVAFCGPCAREQEAYFAIGELVALAEALTAVFIIIDPVFGSRSAKTTPPRLRA